MAIMIDMNFKMPSCCNECQMCSSHRLGMFYCDLTAEYIDIFSDERDADCPLKEVNDKPSGKLERIKQILNDDTYYENYGNNAERFIVSAISEVVEEQGEAE